MDKTKCEHLRCHAYVLPRYSAVDVLSGKVVVTPTSQPWHKVVRCKDCGEQWG